jgi:phenylacetate-CoA ligase
VIAETVRELRQLDDAHLAGLEPLEEEIALVSREQAVRRHRQAHVHAAWSSLSLPWQESLMLEPRIESMDREELRALQERLLRRQIERCAAASDLYRSKLASVGAEPRDVRTLDDLARLPVVTKEELRDDQLRQPPFGSFAVADPAEFREVHPSTGTTGTPVNTIWSTRDVETITQVTMRTLWQFGVRPGDVIQNAFAYGLWVAGLSCHYAGGRLGCLVVPVGAGTATERQIDYLRGAGSTVLLATPSFGLHIAEALRARGIDPAELTLRLGCFGGEAGAENPPTRAKLEAGLAIDAYDYYGLAEVGPTFASECGAKAGIHIAEDYVVVECLDPETADPVQEEELGVLVFTHLTREATPVIRYWSNDFGRLTTEPCSCGRTHVRAVGGIVGRQDDLVVFRGAKFYPSQVERVVRSFGELSDEFRIEVDAPGGALVERCTVVCELQGDGAGIEERLLRELRAELGVTPELRLEPDGTLERSTFKAQRLIRR